MVCNRSEGDVHLIGKRDHIWQSYTVMFTYDNHIRENDHIWTYTKSSYTVKNDHIWFRIWSFCLIICDYHIWKWFLDHIWVNYGFIYEHSKCSYMSIPVYDWPYMIDHIWPKILWIICRMIIYDYPYMITHIWLPIYDYPYVNTHLWTPYMNAHMWTPICEHPYMNTHIWTPIYDHLLTVLIYGHTYVITLMSLLI